MDEKIKTWPLCFPAKKTLIWRRHCSISQSCCSITSKQSIGWFLESFSRERSLNQPKATHVCIRSINQSNHSISVRLWFLFVRAFSFQGHTKVALSVSLFFFPVSQVFEVAREVIIYGFCALNFFSSRQTYTACPSRLLLTERTSNYWYSNSFPDRSPSQYRVLYRCLIIYRCSSDIMRKKVMFV